MIDRRSFLASSLAAPVVITTPGLLMPVRADYQAAYLIHDGTFDIGDTVDVRMYVVERERSEWHRLVAVDETKLLIPRRARLRPLQEVRILSPGPRW